MKTLKQLLLLLSFFITAGLNTTYAQNQPKAISAEDLKKIADGKRFIFNAKYATIDNGGTRNGGLVNTVPAGLGHVFLSDGYAAVINPDSVFCVLPYFGNPKTDQQTASEYTTVKIEENPTKFSTKAYNYAVQQKKKGNVIITIKPINDKEIEKFIFYLTPDGVAKLELTIANYKTIIYDGTFTY